MKKTLVAVAALVATGAFAQVTIGGFVDKAYNTISNTSAAGAKTTSSSIGPNAIGQDQITFGVAEDLGDGLTAYANIRFAPDISAGSGTLAQDVSNVGIKGAFGNLQLASDYGTTWYVINASDATGFGAGAGNVHSVAAGGAINDLVIYSLPTLVPGLGVTLGARAGGTTNKSGDAQAIMLSYSTGGFTAMYAGGKLKNAATTTWQTNGTIGGATAVTDTLALGTTQTGTALTATYDFGMAKVFVGSSSAKSGNDADQKASSYIYGVSVPFGAASFGISSSNASYTSAAATTVKETGLRIMAKYALSKRTSAYLQNGTSKVTGTTRATAQTGLGLTHSF